MSAENRNVIPNQRCCSFCRRVGHRISHCSDERLIEFERLCTNYVNTNGLDTFRQFLLEYSLREPNIVKAFAYKKMNINNRQTIDICIDGIIDYFEHLEYSLDRTINTQLNVMNNDNSITSALLYLFERRMNSSQIELMELMLFMRTISHLGNANEEPEIVDRKFNIETKLLHHNDVNLTEICECNICYESYEKKNFIKLNCSHEFCKECIKKCLKNETKEIPCCAFCRSEINQLEMCEEIMKYEFTDLIV